MAANFFDPFGVVAGFGFLSPGFHFASSGIAIIKAFRACAEPARLAGLVWVGMPFGAYWQGIPSGHDFFKSFHKKSLALLWEIVFGVVAQCLHFENVLEIVQNV